MKKYISPISLTSKSEMLTMAPVFGGMNTVIKYFEE